MFGINLKSKEHLIGLLVAVLAFALFKPMLGPLVTAWSEDPESSHCFLIPFVCGYLIWINRERIAQEEMKESGWGLALLVFGILLYLLSYLGGIDVAQRVSFVVVLNGLVLYNLGMAVYQRILFPMIFLFLMIPIPITFLSMVSFPLQILSTTLSKDLLLFIGVPVIQAGNILHTPKGSLEIVEACSGIRSLVSYITMSLFFAYWNGGRWTTKITLVLSTVPIALGANVVRITFTTLMGVIYGMQIARGFLHDASGFVLFGIGILVFLIESHYLKLYFEKESAPQ